jgi:hypothetical protein
MGSVRSLSSCALDATHRLMPTPRVAPLPLARPVVAEAPVGRRRHDAVDGRVRQRAEHLQAVADDDGPAVGQSSSSASNSHAQATPGP